MTERFLKAKHWQIFLLTFGIPFTIQLGMMGFFAFSLATDPNPNPFVFLNYFMFFPLIMIIFLVGYYGWFWSVAVGLQKRIPEGVTMKLRKFKILFLIPLIYISCFLLTLSVAFYGFMQNLFFPDLNWIPSIMAIVFPLHFFSMFCIFYSLYFVAKTIKTVELQREVAFSDFVGEFFLIWFYPIGIWMIQPKINQMVKE